MMVLGTSLFIFMKNIPDALHNDTATWVSLHHPQNGLFSWSTAPASFALLTMRSSIPWALGNAALASGAAP